MFKWIKGLIAPVLAIFAVVTVLGLGVVDDYAKAQEGCSTYSSQTIVDNWTKDPAVDGFQYVVLKDQKLTRGFVDQFNLVATLPDMAYEDAEIIAIFIYPDFPVAFIYTFTSEDCARWEAKWNVDSVAGALTSLGITLSVDPEVAVLAEPTTSSPIVDNGARPDMPLQEPTPAHQSWPR